MVRFHCPRCQQLLESPDTEAGSKLPCPLCGHRLQIPSPPPPPPPENRTVLGVPEVPPDSVPVQVVNPAPQTPTPPESLIDFDCPYCGARLEIEEFMVGRPTRCPDCRRKLRVP